MASGWGRRTRQNMQRWVTNQTPGTTPSAWFAGLSIQTLNAGPDDGSGITPGTTEPSNTNGYVRANIGTSGWTQPVLAGLDASVPALNAGALSWISSGGGFSTAANALNIVTIWDTATVATVTEAAFYGRANIAVPQAVNAAGITLTIAIGGLSMGFISA